MCVTSAVKKAKTEYLKENTGKNGYQFTNFQRTSLFKVTFPFGCINFVHNLLKRSAQNVKLRYMCHLIYWNTTPPVELYTNIQFTPLTEKCDI